MPDRAAGATRLSGTLTVTLAPGSLLGRIYRQRTIAEAYNCNYGLNPIFRARLVAAGLRITGVDDAGDVRAVELPAHRFFVATLFQPQGSSAAGRPHPLITAYLEAALRFRYRTTGKEDEDG